MTEYQLEDTHIPLAAWYENVDLNTLTQKTPQHVILDPYNGPNGQPWTKEQLLELNDKGINPIARLPLSTVREHTEEYELAERLGILGPEDPKNPQNHAVEFWEPRYLTHLEKKINDWLNEGFKGICLDSIDIFNEKWAIEHYGFTNLYNKVWTTLITLAARLYRETTPMGYNACITGTAFHDTKLAWLSKKYCLNVIIENLITDGSGNLTPEDEFERSLNTLIGYARLMPPTMGIYIFELTQPEKLNEPNAQTRLQRIFNDPIISTVVVEVYATPSYGQLGKAIVSYGGGEWSIG